jgi:flagellin-specific chaperone FliS
VQFEQVRRATDILRVLLAALDLERGGILAEQLRDGYENNMVALMGTVGKPNASECLARIGNGLRELRDAWREIASKQEVRIEASPHEDGAVRDERSGKPLERNE